MVVKVPTHRTPSVFKVKSKTEKRKRKKRERLIPHLPPNRLIAMNITPYHNKVGYLYKLQEKLTSRTDSQTLLKLWTNVSTKTIKTGKTSLTSTN